MRARSVVRRAAVGSALLAALLGAPAVAAAQPAGGAPAGPATTASEREDLPLSIELDAVTGILEPGQDLVVSGTIRNTGDATLEIPRVVVHLERSAFASRTELDEWREADTTEPSGRGVLTVDLTEAVPPGAALPFTVTVPAASVGLRTSASWGPRGLAVEVVDRQDDVRRRQGLARTFTIWFPEQDVTPTSVSLAVPVVGPAAGSEPGTDTLLTALTRPGGRLTTLLNATADRPEITWLLDPWLVQRAAGGAAPAGPAWAERLLGAAADHEVALLPFADVDPSAIAHSGSTSLWDAAVARSALTAQEVGVPDPGLNRLVLPANPTPDAETAALAGTGGLMVVAPGALSPAAETSYTPSARSTVETAAGEVTVLVPDERLSAALETGTVQERLDDETRPDQLTPTTAAQDLLAELAVLTRERPNDARHVLISASRHWDPDPALVGAQLEALEAAPWVRTAPIAELATVEPVDRGRLPEREVATAEISPALISTLEQTLDQRVALASVAERPAALVGDLELERLTPLSVAWRDDPDGRDQVVAAAVARTDALRDAVTVRPGSDVFLVSTTGELPVVVENTLDQPVTVVVALRPSDPRLVADEAVTVTVPGEGQREVLLPVHAVQSADVPVTVELRTGDGVVLDDRTVLTVRVRAEWEGIGAAVLGGLLALGLVLGIVRTIRRGRTAARAAPVVAGPDALSPEEESDELEPSGTPGRAAP
ncbi:MULTISPECIES: DUF6049 family protein [unclassified Actinotalea]|uniref:DUF6049 family protein n=1 Tax=unclassified Actinotalea TaxID=2638618 RepID=UPI0015F5E468|nr:MULTISPECIES: DUF6049 family protein [unclassified Actinotalea]